MSDQFDRILDKLSELQIQYGKIEVRTEMMQNDLERIKEEDARQNELLAEHIAGVKTQAARLDVEIDRRDQEAQEFARRLKEVEFFPTFVKMSWLIIKWLGVPAGAIVALIKLFHIWN